MACTPAIIVCSLKDWIRRSRTFSNALGPNERENVAFIRKIYLLIKYSDKIFYQDVLLGFEKEGVYK